MKAIITNKFILLKNLDILTKKNLQKILSFKDKSKQFQLNKMKKNPYLRNSDAIKEVEKEVDGYAYKELPNGDLVFSSGFCHHVQKIQNLEIEDRREETGSQIALPWINIPFNPRDYQQEAIDIMLLNSNYRGVINMATGLGKTLTCIHFIKKYKRRVLIIVPSDSIAKQFYAEACSAFGNNKCAIYGGGKKKTADITVAIAASIVRNIDVFKQLDLGAILIDECHHTPSNIFVEISKNIGHVGKIFGLTATDFRNDGKDVLIEGACGDTLLVRDIIWGVKNGFLAKPIFYIKEVNTFGRDFSDKLKSYKEHVLKNKLMRDIIKEDIIKSIKDSKSTLCLVAEIEHGEELSKELLIPFAKGEDKNSQEYVNQLNSGKIKGLIGTTGKVGEGTDTKNVDVLSLSNFMASIGIVTQSIGRGLRKTESKDSCIIYDYIPLGSSILSRHAYSRLEFYKKITDEIIIERIESKLKL